MVNICHINIERLKAKLADFHVKETVQPELFSFNIGGVNYQFHFRYIEVEWNSDKGTMKVTDAK